MHTIEVEKMTAQEQTTMDFDVLDGHQYMLLTTFRKSGQPVPTPVWFARDGDRLFVVTQGSSGKVKRIRHSSARVTVEPCTVRGESLGPQVEAQARVLPAGPESQRANTLLNKKYGLLKPLFEFVSRLRGGGQSERVFLEVSPV
jgi:hypothetical protein